MKLQNFLFPGNSHYFSFFKVISKLKKNDNTALTMANHVAFVC